MKMKQFQAKNPKKQGIVIVLGLIVLLFTVVIVLRSFALYEEKKEFDVIKGRVPDQNYDVMFSFSLEDEAGNKTNLETIPEGKDYKVTVDCNNGSTGVWDYEAWGPLIQNLANTRTKCKINFGPQITLIDTIKNTSVVTTGSGLYSIPHHDANITYTTDETEVQNLKQTELRYAGSNPNNYVWFNGELWRMIGLVNTPEGQRVKLVRNESIGSYSWDTSESNINAGGGVNEWSQADIMKLLNPGYETEVVGGSLYWNRSSGTCYIAQRNVIGDCNFQESGLTNEAKGMIDRVTWNTGSNDGYTHTYNNVNTFDVYNIERSNQIEKICTSDNIYCTDTVERYSSWKGKVGLMYPSDYGYATSGGSTTSRDICLQSVLHQLNKPEVSDCPNNNWLSKPTENQWLLSPYTESLGGSYYVFYLYFEDYISVSNRASCADLAIYPSLHLIPSVKLTEGTGEITSPFILKL